MSKVIRVSFGFALLRSVIGYKIAPLSTSLPGFSVSLPREKKREDSGNEVGATQKCKTQTNRDLLARVFPRLTPVACICFVF